CSICSSARPSTPSTRAPRTPSRSPSGWRRRFTSTRKSSARRRASRSPRRRSPSSRTTPTSSASGCRTSSRRISRSSTRPDGLLVVRIALFTNNYLPFCGGVTISVETLRRGLEKAAALRISAGFAAQADAVLAPSAVIRDELHARGVRAPIAVVPTGVDLDRFRPGDRAAARRRLGVGDAEPLVLYVGRLDRE